MVIFWDSLIEGCEFELMIKWFLLEVICFEDVEIVIGFSGDVEDLVCIDFD